MKSREASIKKAASLSNGSTERRRILAAMMEHDDALPNDILDTLKKAHLKVRKIDYVGLQGDSHDYHLWLMGLVIPHYSVKALAKNPNFSYLAVHDRLIEVCFSYSEAEYENLTFPF